MSPEPEPPPPLPLPLPLPTPAREAEVVALTVAAVVEGEAATAAVAGGSGGKKWGSRIMLVRRIGLKPGGSASQGIGRPSVFHAVIVIFLEFFAWGLLTTPMLTGILSFMSAPLIGALSDVWGRKSFLLVTVFFTCVPIPLMKISPWWYFAMIAVSGIFSVTFSVIFAYVADVTQEHNRSTAYGLVSATFAASLVTSPAIGARLSALYGDNLVVLVATVVAVVDICFILLVVPESLPEKIRPPSWGALISWEQADPFGSLRKVGKDSTILLTCITVFLSYLPEAGQCSSFFLYLRQVIRFEYASIVAFIAVVGILSIVAQTVFLSILMRSIGNKNTVLLGLGFQMFQLAWYGFGSQAWMMWAAGAVAAMSSITFPAISALVSRNADADKQGVVQGIITGIRGLCNGLGPALYGFIFFLFHVELNELAPVPDSDKTALQDPSDENAIIPGPPFLFGACAVLLAFLVALFIPEHSKASSTRKHSNSISSIQSNNPDRGSDEDIEPLLQDSSV
ncbi:hippocampus abundant transcript-like protein 1 isoform X2 [Hemicordylus capensis]|uniref:hippocampus abundant transcript-like protein 1 isoform X2 n=1 Tax=Hemicordylus capensis TaxID=884348 RepID=UPI00230289E0|nr:hippocampus abundant transcript-like protein 1 isoform X2 [Hemicordylus capensis]